MIKYVKETKSMIKLFKNEVNLLYEWKLLNICNLKADAWGCLAQTELVPFSIAKTKKSKTFAEIIEFCKNTQKFWNFKFFSHGISFSLTVSSSIIIITYNVA